VSERGLLDELMHGHTLGTGERLQTNNFVWGKPNWVNETEVRVNHDLDGIVPVPIIWIHELALFIVQRFLD
jgi:hypothetical protein